MNWQLVLMIPVLTAVQSLPPPSETRASGPDAVVEVRPFSFNGHWLDIDGNHTHDREIGLRFGHEDDGSVWVTLGHSPGTECTFRFWKDSKDITRASVSGSWSTDLKSKGRPSRGHLTDLETRLEIQTNDWGPGKPLNCRFSVRSMRAEQPTWLLGAFSIAP